MSLDSAACQVTRDTELVKNMPAAAPAPGTSPELVQEQHDCPSSSMITQSRLEALIEQQNLLMLRQLELAEETSKRCESFSVNEADYKTTRQFLKTLDPQVRGIFAKWQKDFRKQVQAYVKQSKLCMSYQEGEAKGELLKPFLEEARKPWEWADFYRSKAVPIQGVDSSCPTKSMVETAGGDMTPEASASNESAVYDIDSAFAELRLRHAWEMQRFVTAHYKAGLEKIAEDLSISNQICLLQEQVAAWVLEISRCCHPHTKQHLEGQAKHFVELVYREEMPKAESRIKAGNVSSPVLENVMRCACMVTVLLAVVTMSHEMLTHLFAVIFALLCGMAMVWEDLVLCSLRVLLGQTANRVRQLRSMPDSMKMHVPTNMDVSIPSILW